MNTKKSRSLLCLILAALMLFLPACSQDEGESSQKEKNEEVLLPISVNGKEIRVGETTVQTLLDEGLDVSWVDESFNRITVDPDMELEANTYYTGGSIKMSNNMSFSISLATEDEPVPLGQAVIDYIWLLRMIRAPLRRFPLMAYQSLNGPRRRL